MKTAINLIFCPWLPALVSMLVFGDWYVDKSSPACPTGTGTQTAPFCAIGAAVAAAANGDTIHIAPGTYMENLTINIDVTLIGTAGQAATIVDGNQAGRVVTIGSQAVVFDGLTLQHGSSSQRGGGILSSGPLTLLNSTVSGNAAGFGGGICCLGVTTVLINSIIENNTAGGQGGILSYGGALAMTNCAVRGNSGSWVAGGLYAGAVTTTLTNCTISGNAATYGGGIYVGGSTTLTNCTISGNGAGYGGGIHGKANLRNCTVSKNIAWYYGGGIDGGCASVRNTVIADNHSSWHWGTYSPDIKGSSNSLGHNLLGNNTSASGFSSFKGDLVGTFASPLNPLLGNLADNGGSTQTMALLFGSPAIDSGDPLIFEPADQRGVPRSIGASDIGAFEYYPYAPGPWIVTFCTAGTTTHGCTAAISGSGLPSATAINGFLISVANVEINQPGIIFYGLSGSTVDPWGLGSSFRCVKYPVERTGTLYSGTSGGACGGALLIDWNQYISTHPTAMGSPFVGGETVWAQAWFRDPPAPKTTSLSDGLQFTVFP